MSRPTVDELEARVREVLVFDLYATQHIDGLTHDGHDLRAIHAEDVDAMIAAQKVAHAALTDLAARAREAEKIVAAAELLTRRDTFDMRIVKVREDNLIELLERRSTP